MSAARMGTFARASTFAAASSALRRSVVFGGRGVPPALGRCGGSTASGPAARSSAGWCRAQGAPRLPMAKHTPSTPRAITLDLTALPALSVDELRALWKTHFGRLVPPTQKWLLMRELA